MLGLENRPFRGVCLGRRGGLVRMSERCRHMRKLLACIAAAALLNGCATCQRHPQLCAAAIVLGVGAVAASAPQWHAAHTYHDCAGLAQTPC